MKTDNFRIVQNDPETYRDIKNLLEDGTVILKWTDGGGSMYTLLLTYGGSADPFTAYPGSQYLYVGVERKGFYGFTRGLPLSPEYVAEKLNMALGSAKPLAELLNGIQG